MSMTAEKRYDPVMDAPRDESAVLSAETPPAPRQEVPEAPLRQPRSHAPLAAGVVVLLLLAAGIGLWLYFRQYESTDDAQIDGHVHPISSRVAGYVLKVNVDDNQYVHAGDVLVEIDPRDYDTALAKAQAELADAEASAQAQSINVPVTSVSTSSQIRGAQADVENARAGVAAAEKLADAAGASEAQAEANDARAQADLPRYRALVEKTEVSQQQYDQALATARASTATVAGARASLAAAEQQVQQARQRLTQAQAALESARTGPRQVAITESRAHSASALADQKRAELEQARLNREYCRIVAPVDGVVNKNVETGMYVQPGQQLLSVVPLDDIWVTANFKETQLHWMRPGQQVTISVDSNGRSYRGRVDSIAGASGARFSLLPPENATGNYVKVVQRIPVKIVLDSGENRDHQLRVGMSVIPTVRVR
jgi:membrane fusion protein (multidrug efflux system)